MCSCKQIKNFTLKEDYIGDLITSDKIKTLSTPKGNARLILFDFSCNFDYNIIDKGEERIYERKNYYI